MREIFRRQRRYGFRQIAQNIGKQRMMKMHAHRFTRFNWAGELERQRDTGLFDVSVEPSSMSKRSNVKLVGIFHRDFGFFGNRLGHDEHLLQRSRTIWLTRQSGLIWINRGRS